LSCAKGSVPTIDTDAGGEVSIFRDRVGTAPRVRLIRIQRAWIADSGPRKRSWHQGRAGAILAAAPSEMVKLQLALSAGMFFAAVAAVAFVATEHGPCYAGRPLADWLNASASTDYELRRGAEAALARLGPESEPILQRALHAKESPLDAGLQAFEERFRPAGCPISPRVPAGRLRTRAAEFLAQIEAAARPAIPALIECFSDEEPEVVRAAQAALRRMGASCVPALMQAIQHRSPAVRQAAADLLGDRQCFGESLTPAVPVLVRALADVAPGVRSSAALGLGEAAGFDPLARRALSSALRDESEQVRIAAAEALGGSGATNDAVTEALRRRLQDSVALVRVAAARALWKMNHDAAPVVAALVSALGDSSAHWRAALGLREIGPEAADLALPSLLDELQREATERPSRTPAAATLALARMGPKAVPGLVRLLASPEASVRTGAATALAGQGAGAAAAVPALVKLLNDPESEAQVVAADALGAVGPAAAQALTRLEAIADGSEGYLRASAQAAIVRIRSDAGRFTWQ
jgi:HEAT repeat protein